MTRQTDFIGEAHAIIDALVVIRQLTAVSQDPAGLIAKTDGLLVEVTAIIDRLAAATGQDSANDARLMIKMPGVKD